jgi:(R)-2-hydroxyacyl-CoA dehydratese activating ATPase
MRTAGIDVGSRTIELLIANEKAQIIESLLADTGFDPMGEAKKLIDGPGFSSNHRHGYETFSKFPLRYRR